MFALVKEILECLGAVAFAWRYEMHLRRIESGTNNRKVND